MVGETPFVGLGVLLSLTAPGGKVSQYVVSFYPLLYTARSQPGRYLDGEFFHRSYWPLAMTSGNGLDCWLM